MLEQQLAAALAAREERGIRRRLLLGDAGKARQLAQSIDFSSNDYLSLARSPEARERFVRRIERGVWLGSTGSRLLDGDSDAHTALESRLATHFHAPSALLFTSGYDANVSLLTTLPQPGDVVVYDALIHASVHDGMRASRAKHFYPFAHNDPRALDAVLGSLPAAGNVFLVLESVYSMDGTVCSLSALLNVFERRIPCAEKRCALVDEAHAVGVYGENGAGLVAALGLVDRVEVRLVTFGKALGCAGAAVLCRPLWREYLVNYARPLIYSTSLAPTGVAAIDTMLDLVCDQKRQHALHTAVYAMYAALGRDVPRAALPPSPIVPVRTKHAWRLAAHLQAAGFLVRPVGYPTVPCGEERIRVCIHAHNSLQEIAALAQAIRAWHGAAL